MPRSRLESAVVLIGVAALALLVWLSVVAWHRYDARRHSASTPVPTTRATAARKHSSAPASRPTTLTLTAVRGASWIDVRAGSASGRQLFAGTLQKSRSLRFPGRRFWLSLGAADNLDARFGERRLRGFPTGVATVAVDGTTVRLIR
jgi:hypothetical protein